ncbi:hypothetical protein ACEQ8H_002113 [Pleosporales sp. CAS-2024a]
MSCSSFLEVLGTLKLKLQKREEKRSWYASWGRFPVNFDPSGGVSCTTLPVLTRARLEQYRFLRDMILSDPALIEWREVDVRGNEQILWRRTGPDDNRVSVQFLTAAELHPALHVKKRRSSRLNVLYDMNPERDSFMWHVKTFFREPRATQIFSPAVIRSWYAEPEHRPETRREQVILDEKNNRLRDEWNILAMRSVWHASPQFRALEKSMESNIDALAGVQKIVCFGLGQISSRSELSDALLQHFFAFDLASRINRVHAKDAAGVRVILQDPNYTPQVKDFLAGGFNEGSLEFVQDPDGVLEIDESTIVMGIYLPMYFPLLQICADLARPVAIITDAIAVDVNKHRYTWNDRSSPKVAKMLQSFHCLDNLAGPRCEQYQSCIDCEHTRWAYCIQMWLRSDAPSKEPGSHHG